jgi:hypothetical protein
VPAQVGWKQYQRPLLLPLAAVANVCLQQFLVAAVALILFALARTLLQAAAASAVAVLAATAAVQEKTAAEQTPAAVAVVAAAALAPAHGASEAASSVAVDFAAATCSGVSEQDAPVADDAVLAGLACALPSPVAASAAAAAAVAVLCPPQSARLVLPLQAPVVPAAPLTWQVGEKTVGQQRLELQLIAQDLQCFGAAAVACPAPCPAAVAATGAHLFRVWGADLDVPTEPATVESCAEQASLVWSVLGQLFPLTACFLLQLMAMPQAAGDVVVAACDGLPGVQCHWQLYPAALQQSLLRVLLVTSALSGAVQQQQLLY